MATSSVRRPGGDDIARPGSPRVGAQASLTGLAATAVRSARDVVGRTFEIAALESRLAGTALAAMAGIALAVVVLLLSAWGLLLAAAVAGLMNAGFEVTAALLLLGAANVLVAGALVLVFLRLTRRLKFPATRRVLEKIGSDS